MEIPVVTDGGFAKGSFWKGSPTAEESSIEKEQEKKPKYR